MAGNLATTEATEQQVMISRTYAAPPEAVFRAWTEPKILERWFAPHGCTIRFDSMEAREGGTFQACLRTPTGHECRTKGIFREVRAPERIVYTWCNLDAEGNAVEPARIGMD